MLHSRALPGGKSSLNALKHSFLGPSQTMPTSFSMSSTFSFWDSVLATEYLLVITSWCPLSWVFEICLWSFFYALWSTLIMPSSTFSVIICNKLLEVNGNYSYQGFYLSSKWLQELVLSNSSLLSHLSVAFTLGSPFSLHTNMIDTTSCNSPRSISTSQMSLLTMEDPGQIFFSMKMGTLL